MAGPTPHYPPEFKREAVKLDRSSERSIPKVAQELGIAEESLRRWIRQHEVDSEEREGLSTQEERQELSRLPQEVRVLKQEREFLKKAREAFGSSSSRRKMGLGELLQAHRGGEDELFYPAYVPDAFGVSRSGYYDWRGKPPSDRSREDDALTVTIRHIHERRAAKPTDLLPGCMPSSELSGVAVVVNGSRGS